MSPSDNPFVADGIESQLATLPDDVAEALIKWRTASLDREKGEALLHAQFKFDHNNGERRTQDEIKSLIRANDDRYKLVVEEIKAEAEYNRKYEKLMSLKRLAGLRTAF